MSIFGNNILGKNIFGNKDAGPAPESADAVPGVQKTDAEWRQELTPEEYHVLRQSGTERPFTGEYWETHTAGVYQCRACGAELFTWGTCSTARATRRPRTSATASIPSP
jgi:peptide-methionine (R)-S-oxide reductase